MFLFCCCFEVGLLFNDGTVINYLLSLEESTMEADLKDFQTTLRELLLVSVMLIMQTHRSHSRQVNINPVGLGLTCLE
jgi:hypothetical protein